MLQIQATWTCERCNETAVVEVGKVPEDWSSVGEMELTIDSDSPGLIDYRLPKYDQRKVFCNRCIKDFWSWVDRFNDEAATKSDPVKEALRKQVERKAPPIVDTGTTLDESYPVDVVEDTPEVSYIEERPHTPYSDPESQND